MGISVPYQNMALCESTEILFPPLTEREIHMFHKADREVFCCLLLKLGLDPAQCLIVMALWLWLENVGYPNVIPQLVGLSNRMLNAMVNEARACLKCLEEETSHIPKGGGLPLTTTLIDKEISLHLFHLRRFTAIAGIKSLLNNVCVRIFADILYNVLMGPGGPSPGQGQGPGLAVPGFPHPLFGNVTVQLPNCQERESCSCGGNGGGVSWRRRPSDDATDDDKTMFLTFSRGFPVTEEEVVKLFTTTLGEASVKAIYMGDAETVNEQPLFATMVVDTVAKVDDILLGKRIAKFKINGKHIWARKYENRMTANAI